MTPNSSTLVNQKLAFAQALLGLASSIDAEEGAAKRLERRALIEASVAGLICTHRHYLHELAESCGIKPAGLIETEKHVLALLADHGRHSAEATELDQLRCDSRSWLAHLFIYYARQWAAPLPPVKVQPIPEPGLIQLIEIEDEAVPGEATLESVISWCQSFNELIQRQRETNIEY